MATAKTIPATAGLARRFQASRQRASVMRLRLPKRISESSGRYARNAAAAQ
jgi:hypothetical protein